MATREEKVRMKQERSLRRIQKRQEKDDRYMDIARGFCNKGISYGRRKSQSKVWECSMQYIECNQRGYCNGDC